MRIIFCFLLILRAVSAFAEPNDLDVSASDKAFFDRLQKAVLAKDATWLSDSAHYPLTLITESGRLDLRSKKDVVDHAREIFTPKLQTVLRKQSRDFLFKNWQGVMVGDGEVWFTEILEPSARGKRWAYRVIIINLDIPKKRAKRRSQPVGRPFYGAENHLIERIRPGVPTISKKGSAIRA